MTVAQMNQYAVSHIELKTSFSKYNLTLGTGTDSSFSPLAEFHVNSTSFNIPISESYLTGNQSNHLVLEIQTPLIESESISIMAYGDSSAGSLFGPAVLLDGTYIVGGIIAGLSTIFGLGFVDIDISRIKPKRRVS